MRHYRNVSELKYSIGELATKSGLSQHTIRAWEKRYGAIQPDRTEKNQRVYDQSQADRLLLLKGLNDLGHSIGRIATLSDASLQQFLQDAPSTSSQPLPAGSDEIVESCLRAIEGLRESDLQQILQRASALMGIGHVLNEVILPLLVMIGDRWSSGNLRIHQEHMATSVIRMFLADQLSSMNPKIQHPRIVVTTPKGQNHEIGALLAGIAAAIAGWNVLYLGPNLPSSDIADALAKSHADALALSIIYPEDDPDLGSVLLQLRNLIGQTVPIFVGGGGANAYAGSLEKIEARKIDHWSDLTHALMNK